MVHFPQSFTIHDNPFFPTGLNYVYRRPGGGIISVLSLWDKPTYEVWDTLHMEEPTLMTLAELQDYLRADARRSFLTIAKVEAN